MSEHREPMLSEHPVTMRLQDEYAALGMLSYTGDQPDLREVDIKTLRALLLAAGHAIESAREESERLRELVKEAEPYLRVKGKV